MGMYGKLTPIEELPDRIATMIMWRFQCDCGRISKHPMARVRSGRIRTCGCSHGPKRDPKTPIRSMYGTYRSGAKRRGLSFALSFAEFADLTSRRCTYCGAEPEVRIKDGATYHVNGIDRQDNLKGYTKCNSVTACRRCNSAKMDGSLEDFYQWVQRLQAFQPQSSGHGATSPSPAAAPS